MKRYSRLISLFLCVAFLISCMVIPASAASDDINSYVYLDFENPQAMQDGSINKHFTVYGDDLITTNTIYLLCSRNNNIILNNYVNSSFTYSVSELWKSGSVCCYKVTANTAYAFRGDFTLSLRNTDSKWGAFNVYQVFYVSTSGIVKLNSSGLTGGFGTLFRGDDTPDREFNIPYFPYPFEIYEVNTLNAQYFYDVYIPSEKFIGFKRVGFTAFSNPDTAMFVDGVSVLVNNSPIPFEVTYEKFDDSEDINLYYFESLSSSGYGGSISPESGTYITAFFDVPQYVSSGSTYTIRFVVEPAHGDTDFYLRFSSLFGIFSSDKTEYQLLSDIYKVLSDLNFDTSDLETAIQQLQTQLHNDLSGIQSGINQSNSFLESIRNNLVNFRAQVINGFTNVGIWFSDLGSNLSDLISQWGQNIVDAIISTNDDAADDFVDKSEDQSSDISDSMDKIDDIVTPDIDDIINPTLPPVDPGNPSDPMDPNAPTEDPASKPVEVLDPETVGSFAGVFGVFFENGMFSSIFSFVLLMMLASYVLFGKK